MTSSGPAVDVHTLGHSTHAAETLLWLLTAAGIQLMVDVRSQPGSGWVPYANPRGLTALLQPAGIDYLWLGDSLGGKPLDPRFYDGLGAVDHAALQGTAAYRAGITQILAEAQARRVCIMCAEEDPTFCHRTYLVGKTLRKHGAGLWHIRGDGRLESDAERLGCPQKALSVQLSLQEAG